MFFITEKLIYFWWSCFAAGVYPVFGNTNSLCFRSVTLV